MASEMKRTIVCFSFLFALNMSGQQPAVPRVTNFSGVLQDRAGKPQTGTVGITFSLYEEEQGGAALWSEVQNVPLDEQGRYAVLLGATRTDGLPLDVFASGKARWLGIEAQGVDMAELPRVLLVGVPYALKAADADTLGGKPASAYALAAVSGGAAPAGTEAAVGTAGVIGGPSIASSAVATKDGAHARSNAACSATSPGTATANQVAVFDASCDVTGNSGFVFTGVNLGIGTSAPHGRLTVASPPYTPPLGSSGYGAYNFLLYDTGAPGTSYGMGIEGWNMGFNSNGGYKFYQNAGATPLMVVGGQGTTNIEIGTATAHGRLTVSNPPYAPPLGSTGYGAYNFLLYDTGAPSTSYGMGIESWNMGFNSNGGYKFYQNGGATPLMVVGGQGTTNVGIGTTTPAATLEVNGNTQADGSMYVDAANTNNGTALVPGLLFGGVGAGEGITSARQNGATNQYGLDFYTDYTRQMSITNGGLVGIGTATPAATLEVNGSTQVDGGLSAFGYALVGPGYPAAIYAQGANSVSYDSGSDGADGINAFGGTGSSLDGDGGVFIGGNSSSGGNGIVANAGSGYAGYFGGAVEVHGALSKSSGSFKIDHPLDPANKYLYHSFVESPDMMNIYNGNAVLDATGRPSSSFRTGLLCSTAISATN